MTEKQFICISCPIGCHLTVSMEGSEVLAVTGNSCKRGEIYGRQEAVYPQRVLTCLMRAENREKPFCVKTSAPVPKELLFQCANVIYETHPKAPIHIGDVVVHNICKTGVDVLATQTLE